MYPVASPNPVTEWQSGDAHRLVKMYGPSDNPTKPTPPKRKVFFLFAILESFVPMEIVRTVFLVGLSFAIFNTWNPDLDTLGRIGITCFLAMMFLTIILE